MCKNSRWYSWLGDFVSSAFSANSAVNWNLKKQTVRQDKLVQFSRFESCPAKVSRPAGM
ncbi:MAG: hypothetical protein HQ580_16460 [Planctomycetes bacterium]|nr:hypothetical protein [Planctomycetota bacterium]